MAAPYHVIVAEDEALVAMLLVQVLEAKGYRVTVAGNGQLALNADADDPADILVTDIRMPKLDGNALVQRMWERHPGLPVIVITAYADEVPQTVNGQLVVLSKPFSNGALLDAIETIAPQASRAGME